MSPIMCIFITVFCPISFTNRFWLHSVYLTPIWSAPAQRCSRAEPHSLIVSRSPTIVTPDVAASHNMDSTLAAGPTGQSRLFTGIISPSHFKHLPSSNDIPFGASWLLPIPCLALQNESKNLLFPTVSVPLLENCQAVCL